MFNEEDQIRDPFSSLEVPLKDNGHDFLSGRCRRGQNLEAVELVANRLLPEQRRGLRLTKNRGNFIHISGSGESGERNGPSDRKFVFKSHPLDRQGYSNFVPKY